jgi:hypothetical protein
MLSLNEIIRFSLMARHHPLMKLNGYLSAISVQIPHYRPCRTVRPAITVKLFHFFNFIILCTKKQLRQCMISTVLQKDDQVAYDYLRNMQLGSLY